MLAGCDFEDIDYLRRGNQSQRKAYDIIVKYGLWEVLGRFSPLVVGTIPINIDVPGSDLDIICEVSDFEGFTTLAKESFSHLPQFVLRDSFGMAVGSAAGAVAGVMYSNVQACDRVVVVNFTADGLPIEIFAQDKPTNKQNAFIHMINEAHLLKINGDAFRQKIIDLKLSGIKTEPAFAMLIGLEGDPYQAMLDPVPYGI